ncbi:hypothetical protein [Streptomyces sp. NPDC101455]
MVAAGGGGIALVAVRVAEQFQRAVTNDVIRPVDAERVRSVAASL